MPARVRFMDYRQGTVFELVNDAHTDRVALYSEIRADAQTNADDRLADNAKRPDPAGDSANRAEQRPGMRRRRRREKGDERKE